MTAPAGLAGAVSRRPQPTPGGGTRGDPTSRRSSTMALNAYMYAKGQKTGDIKGSVTQKGREDSVMVIAFEHEIISPRDAASGLPTGKRQHKPVVITKETDKSTPLFYNVLATNENLTTVKIKFWRPSPTGAEVQFYTIELTNANIASMSTTMPNNKHPELMKFAEYDEIALSYQKITWTITDGGITAMDDWEAPVA
jgi:type VI secretion system secreted protein Hcp